MWRKAAAGLGAAFRHPEGRETARPHHGPSHGRRSAHDTGSLQPARRGLQVRSKPAPRCCPFGFHGAGGQTRRPHRQSDRPDRQRASGGPAEQGPQREAHGHPGARARLSRRGRGRGQGGRCRRRQDRACRCSASTAPPGSRRAEMLRNVDVLVFDIQDIGTRFYTYISTMGLAMQAAAEARIPFVVLDRPNPLGGDYVSGFVLEPAHASFVGQYPIPIVHGMTVGELAGMIKGERWLAGLGALDLTVVAMRGWRRSMRWPELQRPWVATSPNIPDLRGGARLSRHGRGRRGPSQRRTRDADAVLRARRALARCRAHGAASRRARSAGREVRARTISRRARSRGSQRIPASKASRSAGCASSSPTSARFEPLETGMHVLAALSAEARAKGKAQAHRQPRRCSTRIAGTRRLHRCSPTAARAADIIAAWQAEVAQFRVRRAPYLLY